jgi:hypothetical protein
VSFGRDRSFVGRGHRGLRGCALVVLAIVLASSSAHALTVTLDPGTSGSFLQSIASAGVTQTDTIYPVLGTGATALVSDGASSSITSYDLSTSALIMGGDVVRDSTVLFGYGQAGAVIHFAVDQNIGYDITGLMTATDPDGRRVHFEAELLDITAGTTVFHSVQESQATPNEVFSLGLTQGDYDNLLVGNAIGTLVAGHEYRWLMSAFVQSVPSMSAGGGSATASVTLSFVPEPSTALLLGLGLGALATARRRSIAA